MSSNGYRQVFVDTFFIVALINQRDMYHDRALELAAEFDGQPLVTTDAVLLEIGNGLARNFKQQAVEIIDQVTSSPEIEIVRLSPALFEQGYALYKSHQGKEWGLVDCVSFAVMRQKGIYAALTFDQHFVQAGFQALMRT